MNKLTTIGQHFNQIFGDFGYKVDVNGGPINPQIKGQTDIDLLKREEARQAYLLQRETEEINMDNRIFDAQN